MKRIRPHETWLQVLLLAFVFCLVPPALAESADDEMLDLYLDSAERALEQGRHATAEDLFLSAVKRAEALGPQDPRLMRGLKGLAAAYEAQGNPALAEPIRRRIQAMGNAAAPAGAQERATSRIEGDPLSLDSDDTDPKYRQYFERVRWMIKDKMEYPCVKVRSGCDYKATKLVVDFGIYKDGSVPYVIVWKPSEFEVYNEYSVNAIRMAAPFPPIPEHLQDARPGLPVRATFQYVLVTR